MQPAPVGIEYDGQGGGRASTTSATCRDTEFWVGLCYERADLLSVYNSEEAERDESSEREHRSTLQGWYTG
jgi:hypothetical protein